MSERRPREAGTTGVATPRAADRRPARSSFSHRGLRVVFQDHPGALSAIALTVRAGARFDGPRPGLAHLAEHMLFQGTSNLDQVTLNRRAAELGGEHNADTGYEDISLTFEVFNEDLDAALELLAEQYYRTRPDEKLLRKERRVVLEEIRGRLDDPGEQLYQRVWSRFFAGSLGQPVAGTVASVRGIQLSHVQHFLDLHFRHPNTALAVVGGVAPEAVRQAVRRHFGEGRPGPSVRPRRALPGAGGDVRMRSRQANQAYVCNVVAAPRETRPLLAAGLALDIVGSDPDSRLFQELRERLGLSYEVSAHLEWGADWAVAAISASGARAQAERLRRAVEETCRRAADEGFTDDEVRRAHKKLRYRYALLADSRLEQAVALAESVLWGFPPPDEAERIVASLERGEIESAWRHTLAGRSVGGLIV